MGKVRLDLEIPSLNQWLGKHWAKPKTEKDNTRVYIRNKFKGVEIIPPCKVIIHYHETTKNKCKIRDLDNISAVFRKILLDALQCEPPLLPNDNYKYIKAFEEYLVVDSERFVEVEFVKYSS